MKNTKQPNEVSSNISLNADKTDGIMWICSGGNYRLHEIRVGIFGEFLFMFIFPMGT